MHQVAKLKSYFCLFLVVSTQCENWLNFIATANINFRILFNEYK